PVSGAPSAAGTPNASAPSGHTTMKSGSHESGVGATVCAGGAGSLSTSAAPAVVGVVAPTVAPALATVAIDVVVTVDFLEVFAVLPGGAEVAAPAFTATVAVVSPEAVAPAVGDDGSAALAAVAAPNSATAPNATATAILRARD